MLNHNMRGRGTYHRCLAYGRQLVRLGHKVDVMTISPKRRWVFEERTEDGVRIIDSPDFMVGLLRSGWDPWDTVRRVLYLRHGRYDLVHGFDGRPVVRYPARHLQSCGIPYLSDWADWWGRGGVIAERQGIVASRLFAPIETYYEESCRPLADHVTTISTALRRRALSLGIPEGCVTRIPGGTEPDRIRPIQKHEARRAIGMGSSEHVLCYAGFVQYDIEFILEAFSSLCTVEGFAKLLLVGPTVDSRIDALPAPIRRRIWQTGIIEDRRCLLQHLAASDVLLLPFLPKVANIGRWPNKASEYMCLGRPIVTNPVGDVCELIEHGAAVGTDPIATAFAEAALGLLKDPTEQERMGRSARRAAEEVFDYARNVRTLESVYHRVATSAT